MSDKVDSATRSYIMSQVKSKNTKPEMILRRKLFELGYRYRIHLKSLSGQPDIIFTKKKTVIFVHGCFWHGHKNCSNVRPPKTNVDFWENKIKTNQIRDKKNTKLLKKDGWKVIVSWECNILKNADMEIIRIRRYLST